MSDELIIVVDLDGTLKTEHDDVPPYEEEHLTVKSGKNEYVFAARPHIHEFLKAAQKKGRIYLGTASGGGYARKVIKEMGIQDYFDRLICAEEFGRGITYMKNCIFIDNDSEMGELKMGKMHKSHYEGARQDLWVVDTFHGHTHDRTMLDLIEEINGL